MGSLGTAVLDLDTNNAPLNRGLDKAEGKTKRAVGGFSGSTLAIGAAFAGVGLAAKNAWDELANAQKVGAQTDAVLKSTGGVAGVTKKHVEDLAGSISNYSGLDDELVQSGQNMLLTFTKVRNGVGAGNQIFDRATKAIADVSVGLGKDMPQAAILVGKALNDPKKGMTALGRAGVQFTQSQKDAITAMLDAGNTAGAQKLILQELETQFGGSAKAAGQTLPGQLAKARNAFDNLSADILAAAVPALLAFAGAISGVVGFISRHSTEAKIAAAVIGTMAAAITIIIGITYAWGVAQAALNAVMAANPFVLVAILLAALVAGLIVAYKESETFRNIVNGVWNAVKSTTTTVVNFIMGLLTSLKNAFNTVLTWLRGNWPLIATIISGPFAPIVALATDAFGVRSAITGAFSSMLGTVRSTMNSVITTITGLWDNARDAGATLGQNVWNGIKNGIAKVSGLYGELWSKVSSALGSAASSAASGAAAIGSAITNGVVSGLGGLFGAVKSKLESGLRGALSAVNPFSPVEHGGEIYIGRPLVEGAVTGLDGAASAIQRKLDSEVRVAVRGVRTDVIPAGIGQPGTRGTGAAGAGGIALHFHGPVIGTGNERSLGREIARIVSPELGRRVQVA